MIDRRLRDAIAGRGSLLLIEGPAGIGKTRLVLAAGQHGRELGLTTLSARGSELERDFAYGLVRQLFEAPLVAASPPERAELLAGAAGHAARLFGLAAARDDAAEALLDPSFAILHGLYWLSANLGRRSPLLLCVDDVHWADQASLRFLHYLGRRLQELPIAAVAATRPARSADGSPLLAALAADPSAEVLEVAPLSQRAVAELMRLAFGTGVEPAFAAACHEVTGGGGLPRERGRVSGPHRGPPAGYRPGQGRSGRRFTLVRRPDRDREWRSGLSRRLSAPGAVGTAVGAAPPRRPARTRLRRVVRGRPAGGGSSQGRTRHRAGNDRSGLGHSRAGAHAADRRPQPGGAGGVRPDARPPWRHRPARGAHARGRGPRRGPVRRGDRGRCGTADRPSPPAGRGRARRPAERVRHAGGRSRERERAGGRSRAARAPRTGRSAEAAAGGGRPAPVLLPRLQRARVRRTLRV